MAMELDQPRLQLIVNVISITATTSLATMYYFLKRDLQESLAGKLNPPRKHGVYHPKDLAAPPPPTVPEPEQAAAAYPDIRRFVTQRAQGWVAPSESQWKTP